MLQQDPRSAARERDLGLRKIGRLTWRAGLAGAVCSVAIALAFGHHPAAASTTSGGGSSSGSSSSTGSSGTGSSSGGATNQQGQGSIQVPAQPPQQASGPSHATSGGTSAQVP